MHSIRSRLAASLLMGFLCLLTVASIAVYFIAARILEADFDSRLFAKAQAALASISQSSDQVDIDWSLLPQEINARHKHADLLQVYSEEGKSLEGDAALPFPASIPSSAGEYLDLTLPGKGRVRLLQMSFVPHVEDDDAAATPKPVRKTCYLLVASSRHPLDESLHKLAAVLAIMTALTSLVSVGMVWLALRRGLSPLAKLGATVAEIEAHSLARKIPTENLPEELEPIADKLNDLLGRLEVAFARERGFSADLSHELRTPISELKTLSEVMLQQEGSPEERRQAFQDSLAIANHMAALVSVLLEMVRQEEVNPLVKLVEVDLKAQVAEAWRKARTKAAERGLSQKLRWEAAGTFVSSEPHLLQMVLGNLIDNAVEYSPPNSEIDMEWRTETGGPCLVISNRTLDLKQADLANLFERFWRKDKARTESGHFGIGLSLTRVLCQKLRIHLTVSLEKDDLIRFWLRFPPLEKVNEK